MPRYFIEVCYHGKGYAGFQKQDNANTIQEEVEKALGIYFRSVFELTGSSRTDAGVHALQNFFHFDSELLPEGDQLNGVSYHLNAILPASIAVTNIFRVKEDAHCRFDALSRTYHYSLYSRKDPFLDDRAFFYPFALDMDVLNKAAEAVLQNREFEAFAKRNSQVHTYECNIIESRWRQQGDLLIYEVESNRFLRGMVRGLTGTMLKAGKGKLELNEFERILAGKDSTKTDFSVPAHGLCLCEVKYPEGMFE